jgi:hypothetical protein
MKKNNCLNNLMYLFNIIFTIIVSLTLTSCTGTETGNPITNVNIGTPPTSGSEDFQKLLLSSVICKTITRCFSEIDFTTCETNVKLNSQFSQKLGFQSNYANLGEIETAENQKTIQASTTYRSECNNSINNLTCDQAELLNGFNRADPGNYNSVDLIINVDVACTKIYNP